MIAKDLQKTKKEARNKKIRDSDLVEKNAQESQESGESKKSKKAKKPQDSKEESLGVKEPRLVTEDYFNEELNSSLLAQYIRVYMFNQRKGNAKTKTRGEVSGSGKKPWRQKYTGRARVGDKRNPLWRHGGVSHGPVPRDYSLSLPKKMLAKAMRMFLSQKIKENKLYLIDELKLDEPKTKVLANILNLWDLKGKTLFVVSENKEFLTKASSNLKSVRVRFWENLNAFDILSSGNVVIDKKSFESLKAKYGN